MTNVAISYARFSSAKQSEGDSLRRQIEAAEAYAAANNLSIDRTLSFTDLGVSAYDQSNVHKGALGLFLRAAQDGKIPIGATLIIESFDRLSRASPFDALGIFSSIISAGLNLVTLTSPPKLFSRASIDANMFQLFEALMDMHRANAESARKSQLLSSAWSDKKERAKSGELMSGKAPHWIDVHIDANLGKRDPNKRKASLNPERAETAMRIVEMAEQGVGNHTIIRTLHSEGVEAWAASGKWEPSYIQKLLTSPALYGGIELDGEVHKPFYPALIAEERYDLLQSLRSARATTKNTNRKGKMVTNLFSGLLKCGYCGSAMNIAGYKSRVSGYERKYVACHGARTAATKCRMFMWFLDELEPSLLFWLTRVDYARLLGTGRRSDSDTQKELLASYEQQAQTLKKRIDTGHEAILDGVDSLRVKVKAMEAELSKVEKLVEAQQRKVNALANQDAGGGQRMKTIVLLFKTLKNTTDEVERRALREQLSAGVNLVVERITLYPAGHNANGTKEDRFIDVLFRNGAQQRIETSEC